MYGSAYSSSYLGAGAAAAPWGSGVPWGLKRGILCAGCESVSKECCRLGLLYLSGVGVGLGLKVLVEGGGGGGCRGREVGLFGIAPW